MAAPVSSHLISGTVFDLFGSALAGATVTVKHSTIGPTAGITKTTNSSGAYIINLSKLDSQWSVGDTITVKASKTAEGTKTVTTTIESGGGQTVNITLAETSDLSFAETDATQRHNLVFALPIHYDGEKVTRTRPLPVQAPIDIDLVYNPAHIWAITNSDGQPDSETVTLADGNSYKRTFAYTNVSGARILTSRSKWEKQ